MKFPITRITQLREILNNHPLLSEKIINNRQDLQHFMECHVFAVFDFMSLIKTLQHQICPSTTIWLPSALQRKASRFVNEIILAEESDVSLVEGEYISHYDLYIQAMREVGADPDIIIGFEELVREFGIEWSLDKGDIPESCYNFVRSTFDFINTDKPHVVAAAFCFGRETVIPDMFTGILDHLGITESQAPGFFYYLRRHIEVDGGEHGPASIKLIETLCDNDPIKLQEAELAALDAIQARIRFWNEVRNEIIYR